jgi:multidrug transporter EmrE-like cation transporter
MEDDPFNSFAWPIQPSKATLPPGKALPHNRGTRRQNFSIYMSNIKNHIYIFITVLAMVYCQVAVKWHMSRLGALPVSLPEKLGFLVTQLLNPWILSALAAAFLAALSWMAAMTRFDLSYAYPFTSLSFVLVLALSAQLFNEPVNWPKLIGLSLIISGIIVGSRG